MSFVCLCISIFRNRRSFRLDCSCLSIVVCFFIVHCFLVFQGQKPTFLIFLTWVASLKTNAFLPDCYHSFTLCYLCRVTPKIAVKCKLVVFPSLCFVFASLIFFFWFLWSSYVYLKKTANIPRMTIGSLMLAIGRAPADHDIQTCA